MDILTIVGLLVGVVAIVGGNALEGGHISGLLNAPAAVIVIGGTLGAAMLQTPKTIFLNAFLLIRWAFFPPAAQMQENIQKVINWSFKARKEGLLGLEAVAEQETDPFARKGLQLLIDAIEPAVRC